jgi:uncharacterized UPF0160 family protein
MIPHSVGTHDGTFHADEVTACALLVLFKLVDREKIFRTRDEKRLALCEFVCDVGGVCDAKKKRFDHHQAEYTGELSSAGMVLAYLRDQKIFDQETYEFFNRSLVLGIDAHDNGRVRIEPGVCTFSNVISNFVPPMYDAAPEVQEKAFGLAFEFALGHLTRMVERHRYIALCKEKVERVMAENRQVLLFDEAMPWLESFFDLGGERHPALFVVMPSSGHWKLRGIPPNSIDRMEVRRPLPAEWAGLRDGALESASGIKGAIFCHKGRFVSVWETREAALEALEKVLRR